MSETKEKPETAGEPAPHPAEAPAREPSAALQIRIPEVMPVIGSGSTIMYPQQLMPVLATEEPDIRAIDEAAASEAKLLGIFAQAEVEGHFEGDLSRTGTAATIVRMAKAPDGTVHAILQGIARIRLLD